MMRGMAIGALVVLMVTDGAVAAGSAEGSATTEEHAVSESGTLETRSFFSSTLDRDYRYNLYLPAAYDENEQYPVLYLLHGRGDTMAGWTEAVPVLDELISRGLVQPVLAVMPDVPSNNRGSYFVDSLYAGPSEAAQPVEPAETAFFSDLVPHIDETFPTVPDRRGRVVGGYSMGGYGAARYVLAHADVLSAAIVLSPAIYTALPPRDSSTREFGAFGLGDDLFDPQRYRELNYPRVLEGYSGGRHPVKAFIAVGDDEWKHPDPADAHHDLDMEAHILFNRLARVNGVEAEFRVYDGGHDWTVWNQGLIDGLTFLADHLRLSAYSVPADESESGTSSS